MITVTGQLGARIVMGIAGGALAAVGIAITITGRTAAWEGLVTGLAIFAGGIAALWLGREKRRQDRDGGTS